MTISSVGYAGTVTDEQWALLAGLAVGSQYGVDGYDAWRVTAGVGTRVVQVAAGKGWGWGVLDDSDAVTTMPSLSSVPSGSRWDLIVARRDWGTGDTTFEVVEGGSSKAIPNTREVTPGTLDEQPLALVRVAAGSTAIQEVVDLRVMASVNGAIAFDTLVLSYMNRVGSEIYINGTRYTRVVSTIGTLSWVTENLEDTDWLTSGVSITSPNSAWSTSSYRLRRRHGRVEGRVVITRVGGTLTMDSGGRYSAPSTVCVLPANWRPTMKVLVDIGGVGTSLPLFGQMDTDGAVVFEVGIPNHPISTGDSFIVQFNHLVS